MPWKTFHHNGVMFPLPYKQHNIPIICKNDDKNEKIQLTSEQEEYATIYARYLNTEYNTEYKTFNNNFFKDWKTLFKLKLNLTSCDFSAIKKYLDKQKEQNKLLTKEQKDKNKKQKDLLTKKYKTAIVDGKSQPVGNFMVEPPSIFIGRGAHPSLGKIKWRIKSSDVTLNLSKDAPIPVPNDGGKWAAIVHEPNSYWLARWKCPITDKTKYVWLSDKSSIKGNKDMQKFEVARKLGTIIDKMRKEIVTMTLHSKNEQERQLAVVLYLIDYFALRIGNEKGSDEADTVGTVSLRLEHLTLLPDNKIKLDFLGKDSVRFVNIFKVTELVHKNLTSFIKGKSKDDNIFDLISTSTVNTYLSKKMKKLTARVFRTYNASKLYEQELLSAVNGKQIKLNPIKGFSAGYLKNNERSSFLDRQSLFSNSSNTFNTSNITNASNIIQAAAGQDRQQDQILKIINDANIAVAVLCNHQKNVGKNDVNKITLKEKIDKLDKNSPSYKKKITLLKEKEKYKHLALGTSKLNYIDPRITVSFLKQFNIPVTAFFNASQIEKFAWAMDATNFRF